LKKLDMNIRNKYPDVLRKSEKTQILDEYCLNTGQDITTCPDISGRQTFYYIPCCVANLSAISPKHLVIDRWALLI